MFKKTIIFTWLFIFIILAGCNLNITDLNSNDEALVKDDDKITPIGDKNGTPVEEEVIELPIPIEEEQEVIELPQLLIELNDNEFDLLIRLVEAESGNQSYEGKLAVANVVLNRLFDSRFPNTIQGVVYQKNQFEPVSNGMIDRVNPTTSTIEAVSEALIGVQVVDNNVIYFWAHYVPKSSWIWTREQVVQIGDHIFGKNPL